MIRLVDLLKEIINIELNIPFIQKKLQGTGFAYDKVTNPEELKKLKERFDNTMHQYVKGNKITLYRALAADDESDIDTTSFGIAWAAEEYYAQVYERDEEMSGMGLYLVTADFKTSDVDWDATFISFIQFGFREKEIIIKTTKDYKSVKPIKYQIEKQGDFE